MTVLGVYVFVPNPKNPDQTHAWISLEKGGVVRTFSSYSDRSTASFENNQQLGWDGSGTHVRENVDLDHPWTSRRFKRITPDQEVILWNCLKKKEVYGTMHNNCAHFAARVWQSTTGESLDISHQAPTSNGRTVPAQSPVGLANAIGVAEKEMSTSQLAPLISDARRTVTQQDHVRDAVTQAYSQSQGRHRNSSSPADLTALAERLRRQWSRDAAAERSQGKSGGRDMDEE